MNQNNLPTDKEKNNAIMKIIQFFSIVLAGAIIGFCYALAKIEDTFPKILVISIASLIAFLSIVVILIMIIGNKVEKNRKNFFLYDAKRNVENSVDKLTVATVRERLVRYMAAFKVRGKLYIGDLFDEKRGAPDHFRPLFCYELLCEIAENNSKAETILSFGLECAETFEKYLNQSKDYDLALDIKLYFIDFSAGKAKSEDFGRYVTKNKAHIEEKMLSYAKENIEKFI